MIGFRMFMAGWSLLLAFGVTACREQPSAQTDAEMKSRIIGTWVLDDGPLSLYYMEKTYAADGTASGFLLNRQTGKRIDFTSCWEIKDGYLMGEVSSTSDPALLVGGNYLNKIVKMTDKRFIMVQGGTGRVTIKHRKGRFALF
ncbi:MAG TPA: hypothetical protein VJ281_04785 [Chthoniobacterales bacterium]|nr:hypothetical protein [Chthoniobacterales bacterium]